MTTSNLILCPSLVLAGITSYLTILVASLVSLLPYSVPLLQSQGTCEHLSQIRAPLCSLYKRQEGEAETGKKQAYKTLQKLDPWMTSSSSCPSHSAPVFIGLLDAPLTCQAHCCPRAFVCVVGSAWKVLPFMIVTLCKMIAFSQIHTYSSVFLLFYFSLEYLPLSGTPHI